MFEYDKARKEGLYGKSYFSYNEYPHSVCHVTRVRNLVSIILI